MTKLFCRHSKHCCLPSFINAHPGLMSSAKTKSKSNLVSPAKKVPSTSFLSLSVWLMKTYDNGFLSFSRAADWWRNWISWSISIFAFPTQMKLKTIRKWKPICCKLILEEFSFALNYQFYHQINSHRNRSLTSRISNVYCSTKRQRIANEKLNEQEKRRATFFASIETQLKFNVEIGSCWKSSNREINISELYLRFDCEVFVQLIALLSSSSLWATTRAVFIAFILFKTH